MADSRINEEIITQFLLNTCLPNQQNMHEALLGWYESIRMTTAHHYDNDGESARIVLITGSTAEFYIQPMFSCIGDIDLMFHRSNHLTIPADSRPPTQLPAEFDSRVEVFEIIDSDYPGFVYLVSSYLLTECVDDGKYYARPLKRRYLPYNHILTAREQSVHGPALTSYERPIQTPLPFGGVNLDESRGHVDHVQCIRCLSWPPQSADWPTRHRKYGWPDSATVDRVVSDGSDVVPVAHHLCREDEWLGHIQWRLSFSRAEIVLLNSWTPVQQTVYHMLRVFVKNERLTERTDNPAAGTLRNYHIKTLMMWACELKPPSWWTDDVNIVRICVERLQTLSVWMTSERCQHYFINNCNLFDSMDNSYNSQATASRLMSVTRSQFCAWFKNYYLDKCDQSCQVIDPLQLFKDISTRAELQNAVPLLDNWRWITSIALHSCHFFLARQLIPYCFCTKVDAKSCSYLIRQLANIYQGFTVYFTAIVFLHAASKSMQDSPKDEILDVLLVTLLYKHFSDVRRCVNARHSSALSLSIAMMLMKDIANNSRSTVQLIEIELSKAYLYRALRLSDSDSDSIYCLANVYLAVLYYTTGQYQKAIDHCTLVTRSHDHSQCGSHVVQGELLPKIDDDVDNILGLSVFYEYIRTAALSPEQQTRHVSVFTTEQFAHYLHIKCLSATERHYTAKMALINEIRRHRNCVSKLPGTFITDFGAFNFINHTKYASSNRWMTTCKSQTKPWLSYQWDTSMLVVLLQKSAVEHLTTFRQIEQQQFGGIDGAIFPNVTTDYEALYAYKCDEYQRCLQLSTQNVNSLVPAPDHRHLFICVNRVFIPLMDDDIVSLIGLIKLINPFFTEDNVTVESITLLSLSLYLMTQCQIKLHHSVRSLAWTLDDVEVARRKLYKLNNTMDLPLLKLIERMVLRYICE